MRRLGKRYRQWRAQRRLADELPAMVALLVQGLRAGMNLLQALQLAADQPSRVTAPLCAGTVHATTTGRPLTQELLAVAAEWQNPDLQTLALMTAALYDSGGNLAKSFERLGEFIRRREQLRRKVALYATQGIVSAVVIAVLPLLLSGLMALIVPRLIAPLWQTLVGWGFVSVALGLQLCGLFWMRRILRPRI